MTKDLTQGSPIKAVISFGIPILLGSLFQQVYNATDTAIVGRFVSMDALGGVGATGAIQMLILGLCMGTCNGFSICISQAFGARDEAKVKAYFMNSIYLAFIFAVVLTTCSLIYVDEILEVMRTPKELIFHSKAYLTTILAGIMGMTLYNLLASVLRALGDSKTPLYFLLGSAVVNLVLDLLFIIVLKLGVQGTSLATVISQTLAGICCIFLIRKKFDILKGLKPYIKPNIGLMAKLLSIGLPMGLQISFTAIGSVIMQYAVNGLGALIVNSIAATGKITCIFIQPFDAFGASLANFSGQNIGARRFDRVEKVIKQQLFLGFAYSIFVFVVLFFTGQYLAQIFVDPSQTETISAIKFIMQIQAASFLVLSVLVLFRNALQGLGYSSIAMLAGIFETIARVSVAGLLVERLGILGAALANPLAWVAATLFLVPAYLFVRKKIKRTIPNAQET